MNTTAIIEKRVDIIKKKITENHSYKKWQNNTIKIVDRNLKS